MKRYQRTIREPTICVISLMYLYHNTLRRPWSPQLADCNQSIPAFFRRSFTGVWWPWDPIIVNHVLKCSREWPSGGVGMGSTSFKPEIRFIPLDEFEIDGPTWTTMPLPMSTERVDSSHLLKDARATVVFLYPHTPGFRCDVEIPVHM